MEDFIQLEVKDFGPIVEAKIDLRPLTVFIGPSNTGKSYLAILIYALHRYFGGDYWPRQPRLPTVLRHPHKGTGNKISEMHINALADMQERINTEENIVLPDPIMNQIRSMLAASKNELGDAIGDEIGRCFGIGEIGSLIRKASKKDTSIVLRKGFADDSASVESRLAIGMQETKFVTDIGANSPICIDFQRDQSTEYLRHAMMEATLVAPKSKKRDFFVQRLLRALANYALRDATGSLSLSAFYLPADRTGVMHAHNVVVNALLENASRAGLRPTTPSPMLSGILADFLEQLIEIDSPPPRRRRRVRYDLGEKIEQAVLGGSVRIGRSEVIGHPQFTYRPKGWKTDLPLANTSSMVSELAPVVLYLRHVVRPGNVLIIEEPESHLHPAMQVEFTRQLAMLVHLGIRVIVTTHSEWVLETLANIVRRSDLPESLGEEGNGNTSELPFSRRKRGGEDLNLPSHLVGAWRFQPKQRPKGSVISEISLDESGLYPTGFDDVAIELHHDWTDISNRQSGNAP